MLIRKTSAGNTTKKAKTKTDLDRWPALRAYCETVGFPIPEVVAGTPAACAVASCDPSLNVIIIQSFDLSAHTMGHELAHLIARRTNRMDSITHGPLFREIELVIQNFVRDWERRKIRAS